MYCEHDSRLPAITPLGDGRVSQNVARLISMGTDRCAHLATNTEGPYTRYRLFIDQKYNAYDLARLLHRVVDNPVGKSRQAIIAGWRKLDDRSTHIEDKAAGKNNAWRFFAPHKDAFAEILQYDPTHLMAEFLRILTPVDQTIDPPLQLRDIQHILKGRLGMNLGFRRAFINYAKANKIGNFPKTKKKKEAGFRGLTRSDSEVMGIRSILKMRPQKLGEIWRGYIDELTLSGELANYVEDFEYHKEFKPPIVNVEGGKVLINRSTSPVGMRVEHPYTKHLESGEDTSSDDMNQFDMRQSLVSGERLKASALAFYAEKGFESRLLEDSVNSTLWLRPVVEFVSDGEQRMVRLTAGDSDTQAIGQMLFEGEEAADLAVGQNAYNTFLGLMEMSLHGSGRRNLWSKSEQNLPGFGKMAITPTESPLVIATYRNQIISNQWCEKVEALNL